MPPVTQTSPPAPVPTPVRIRPKIGRNVLLFSASIFLILFVLATAGAFAVAKTGVVHVPVWSSFYHGPTPTRVVETEKITASQLEGVVADRFRSAAMRGEKPPYSVWITEQELSGSIQSSMGDALRAQSWQPVTTQLAVRQTDLEFYGKLVRGPFHLDLLARFVPRLQNGVISFDPVYIQVGDYPVAPDIAKRISGMLFARDLGSWEIQVGSSGVQSIKLSDGAVQISATPATP